MADAAGLGARRPAPASSTIAPRARCLMKIAPGFEQADFLCVEEAAENSSVDAG